MFTSAGSRCTVNSIVNFKIQLHRAKIISDERGLARMFCLLRNLYCERKDAVRPWFNACGRRAFLPEESKLTFLAVADTISHVVVAG
jgi:hypothetical protein